jgi:hypothetical protein
MGIGDCHSVQWLGAFISKAFIIVMHNLVVSGSIWIPWVGMKTLHIRASRLFNTKRKQIERSNHRDSHAPLRLVKLSLSYSRDASTKAAEPRTLSYNNG